MSIRLPFRQLVSHPTSSLLLLIFGSRFQVVDTDNGKLVHSEESPHKEVIIDGGFSPDGSYFASTSDDKDLKIWDTKEWKCLSSREVVKRATALKFSRDSKQVLVSDKFGDVFSFDLHSNTPAKLLLGHLSLVTDLELTPNYIITSDRDEKVRVSQLPHTFIIQSYCLGHSQFVSTLHVPSFAREGQRALPLVLSGGGDSLVNLWRLEDGVLLDSFNFVEVVKGVDETSKAENADIMTIVSSPTDPLVAVIAEEQPYVVILRYEEQEEKPLVVKQVIKLEDFPTDISFAHNGLLWLSSANPSKLLSAFVLDGNQFSEVKQHPALSEINANGSCLVKEVPNLFTYKQLRKVHVPGQGSKSKKSNKGSDSEGESDGGREGSEEPASSSNKRQKVE